MNQLQRIFLTLLFLLTSLCPLTSRADSPDRDPATAWFSYIKRTLRSIFSVKAEITQEIIKNGAAPPYATATGTMELRRGGRFRLTFENPSKTVFVSNAEETWYYIKGTKTAYQLSNTDTLWHPLFESLLGKGDWEDFVIVHMSGPEAPRDDPQLAPAVFRITPKSPDRYVDAIILTVDTNTPCIRRMLIVTQRADIIRITIENPKTNVGIGARRFTFTPPKRARIVPQ